MDEHAVAQLWTKVCQDLRTEVSDDDFNRLIAPLSPSARGNTIVLEAPDVVAIESIAAQYLLAITRAVEKTASASVSVQLRLRPGAEQQELFPPPPVRKPPVRATEQGHEHALLARYTFENFVVGASNQFAHAACQAVARQPGERYNPLFIYGGVGLGKTHLVNAIGHAILARNPRTRVMYLSAESFMNELIGSLRKDRMDDFKNRFRRADVLILDDAQFFAARERTQEEFFHTFNSLHDSGRQIVLTSDKFPKDIPALEERLRNRFEWGLIADIQSPDLETRVAILEKKAEVEGIDLPHDVALFLAHHVDSNVRELEGSLTRLGAFASLNRAPLTVDFAREVLASMLRTARAEISIETIQKFICEFFDLRTADLRSKRRNRNITQPRQLAMYLCRRHTHASYPTIGRHFGGRDHSTVIHAINVIETFLREDANFRATVERIERSLHSLG